MKYLSKVRMIDGELYELKPNWSNITDKPLASDDTPGLLKTNSDAGIVVDENGKLTINGGIGKKEDGGNFLPATISPVEVGKNSLLITEGTGTTLGAKSLSVTTGVTITLSSSHAAGVTQYKVKNNYVNRILCSMIVGGAAAANETNGSIETVRITSVKYNNADFSTPSSTAGTSGEIIITTEKTINPSEAISSIRIYPTQKGFSNLLVGAGGHGPNSPGYSVLVGQYVFNKANAAAVFGNSQYNAGNSSLLAGRQHINTKQNAFLAGQGHDSSSASNNVAAVGAWSSLSSSTLFAVGYGTSETARKNAFEVDNTGNIYLNSSDGQRWKISVSTSGALTTAKA